MQSEPLDEDENDQINIDEDPVVDLEVAAPLPLTTLVMPKIVPLAESTVVPKITIINKNHSGQPKQTSVAHQQFVVQASSNGSAPTESNTDHLRDTACDMLDQQYPVSNDQPENAFLPTTNGVAESVAPTTDDRLDLKIDDTEDNIAYQDIACAVSTLSGAVGTLSTALNGHNPLLTGSTKAL